MASSDKIWHYEQVGFLPGKISWSFCGPQVKIKDSEYAKKCGIGGDCYFYVSKVTLFSAEKGHFQRDFLFEKAVFKLKSQVRSERVVLVCIN